MYGELLVRRGLEVVELIPEGLKAEPTANYQFAVHLNMSETNSGEKTMEDWRRRIDELDLQLVKLFNERTHCAIEIGHIKKRLGLEIYSPAREQQVIANVTAANYGP